MEQNHISDTVTAELIVVRQLPEIEERLRAAKDSVDKRVSDALSMVCTEENVTAEWCVDAKSNGNAPRSAVKAMVLYRISVKSIEMRSYGKVWKSIALRSKDTA